MYRDYESNGKEIVQFMDGLEQYEKLPKIPTALYTTNRDSMVAKMKEAGHTEGFVLLKGGTEEDVLRWSSDAEDAFRQESYFWWAFGVQEPGFLGGVDLASGKSYLFIPQLPESFAVISGQIYPPEFFKTKYAVDDVKFTDDIAATLQGLKAGTVFVNVGVNSDSGSTTMSATFDGIDAFKTDRDNLHPIITECRVFKSAYEIEVLRYANRVASASHIEVFKQLKEGMGEHQLEALFKFLCFYKGGCRLLFYGAICATGIDNAVLHYAQNNKAIKNGDITLLDMGCEYGCYGSDITVVWPVSGKYTEDQKIIYNAVYESCQAVIKAVAPGVNWADMHRLSNRVILEHLIKAGILKGDIEEMMSVHLGGSFMPHGLGHLMGCDVHDVGGYNPGCPERIMQPGFKSLRTARDLKAGMVITVEPGCYFNHSVLTKGFADPNLNKFMNEEVIRERFWNVGGVRIEENILITENGCEVFTSVPRKIEDIEAVKAGTMEWKHENQIFANAK